MPTYKVRPILVHNEFVVDADNAEEAKERVIWDELPYLEWDFEVEEVVWVKP